MAPEIGGDYKRVNESHYSGKTREVALGGERIDGKRHLAEFEEYVRTHKKKERRDTVEIHEERDEEENPHEEPHEEEQSSQNEQPTPETPSAPPTDEDNPPDENTPPHLDITI